VAVRKLSIAYLSTVCGTTPLLRYAIDNNWLEVLEWLLTYRYESFPKELLQFAILNGRLDAIRPLCKYQQDFDAETGYQTQNHMICATDSR
jgi:hypothetical protein